MSKDNTFNALKNNWISLENFSKIPHQVLCVIMGYGYNNNGVIALENGLLDINLLANYKWKFIRDRAKFDSTDEGFNFRSLLCSNAFIALEEHLITTEEALSMPSSDFITMLCYENEVLNLLREHKISAKDMLDIPSSDEITEFINQKKTLVYFRFIKNCTEPVEVPPPFPINFFNLGRSILYWKTLLIS